MNSKQIKGFPSYYITTDGEVISYKGLQPRILKPLKTTQNRKYLSVILYGKDKNGKRFAKQKYIHRLVYEAFVNKIPKKTEVDHIDCNPENNKLSNLQLLSSSENKRKSMKHRWGKSLRNHRDEFIALKKEGKTLKEISQIYDCGIISVWKIIHDKVQKRTKDGKNIWVPYQGG